jgi:hypothetical protein
MKRFLRPACAGLILLASWSYAIAASVFKYRDPGGSVTYSGKALPNRKPLLVLQVRDPSPPSSSIRAMEAQRRQAQLLYGQILESRRLDLLEAQWHSASSVEPTCAQLSSDRSWYEPLPGERSGTVSGHSRLNDHYWKRLGMRPSPRACAGDCTD